MPEAECPDHPTLSAFLAGRLPEHSVEAVRLHLRECPKCRKMVDELAAGQSVQSARMQESGVARIPAPSSGPRGSEMPAMSDDDLPALGRLGEYLLLEKLGAGGMGTVYKALHTELDRVVALKVLNADRLADDRAVVRFQREMKAVGQLNHPNIVVAHDAREIAGTRVLVTEYVDGLDLAELVRRLGPLPVADACELIRQAALGLESAHRRGLVHRDVKPSNLMLSSEGRLKILDLGLARFLPAGSPATGTTASGMILGTPDYMAPEQASASHTVDARSDIYSLGCTLYELLTGRPPFDGPQYTGAGDKMAGHLRDPAPPIERFRRELPETLTRLLDRMLAKQPADRIASAREVAEALGPLASGSNLPALLSQAGHQPVPGRTSADWTGVGQSATPVMPVGPPARRTPSLPLTRRPLAWWRRRRAIAVGLILILGAAGVTAIILSRPQDNGTANLDKDRRADERSNERAGDRMPTDAASDRLPAERTVLPPSKAVDRGWLVFSWTIPRVGKPDLWLFSLGGTRRHPVTRSPDSFDMQPQFSPNGRQIAFIRGRDPRTPTSLWVCDTDGSRLRQLAAAEGESELLVSPVWASDSEIYYARHPDAELASDTEIWRASLDGGQPRLAFRLRESVGESAGQVTDVSPDGRHLLMITHRGSLWPTADVHITDTQGRLLHTLWADFPDERKDARALWSPDGKTIAWHHFYSGGVVKRGPLHTGVGLARLQPDGKWIARLQPDQNKVIVPLAWSPDSSCLLCAEIHDYPNRLPDATLFLMDHDFRLDRVLFRLKACCWKPSPGDFGRLADWGVLPENVPLPPPVPSGPRFRRPEKKEDRRAMLEPWQGHS